MESKRKLEPSILQRTLRILVPVLLFAWVIQSQVGFVSSHAHSHDDHDHGHHHGHQEPASFKYSKEANEHAHSHGHDDHHDHGHSHGSAAEHHHHDHAEAPRVERDFNIWLHAIGSTLLISAAPFFILFFIKVDNSKEKEKYLKILLSFASGGLLGDAFLHLIPHAIMAKGGDGHGHSHGHSHGGNQEKPKFTEEELQEFHGHDLSVGIWVLVGIVTFLVVEKLIRIANGGHGHSHSHSSESPKKQDDSAASKKKKDGSKSPAKKEVAETKSKGKPGPVGEIKVAGYLNLAADFLHNFTDGLAIGASYLAGQPVGMVTTFTVLLHEIPHEIGDFAILIQSGSSRKKAIFLQLLTALGALAGTVVSLWYGDIGDAATSGVLPFTAGGFIYIATVSVIPDLLQNSTFGQSVKEIIALLFGVYMMVFIAKFE